MNSANTPEIIAKAKKLGAEYAWPNGDFPRLGWEPVYGFDKREAIAVAALQGYLASFAGHESSPTNFGAARAAVEYADALLLELAK